MPSVSEVPLRNHRAAGWVVKNSLFYKTFEGKKYYSSQLLGFSPQRFLWFLNLPKPSKAEQNLAQREIQKR